MLGQVVPGAAALDPHRHFVWDIPDFPGCNGSCRRTGTFPAPTLYLYRHSLCTRISLHQHPPRRRSLFWGTSAAGSGKSWICHSVAAPADLVPGAGFSVLRGGVAGASVSTSSDPAENRLLTAGAVWVYSRVASPKGSGINGNQRYPQSADIEMTRLLPLGEVELMETSDIPSLRT